MFQDSIARQFLNTVSKTRFKTVFQNSITRRPFQSKSHNVSGRVSRVFVPSDGTGTDWIEDFWLKSFSLKMKNSEFHSVLGFQLFSEI